MCQLARKPSYGTGHADGQNGYVWRMERGIVVALSASSQSTSKMCETEMQKKKKQSPFQSIDAGPNGSKPA